MKEMMQELLKNTKSNFDQACNELCKLEPKAVTKEFAECIKEQYEEAEDPIKAFVIVAKVKSAFTLLQIAQNHANDDTRISEESKEEYKRLIVAHTLLKNPNTNIRHLYADLNISTCTCPSQEEMDKAIIYVKRKLELSGLSHLAQAAAIIN